MERCGRVVVDKWAGVGEDGFVMDEAFPNPILPGFFPDPSICRVGGDFFLATSTFEYFPGVPVFHSRDLRTWTQLGHCLTRESQLPLEGARSSGGIFAPTLRHHAGKFYMVTTNVTKGGHFIVTAADPRGPWSEPVWVKCPGIDPDLFFDEDGSAYFTYHAGTKPNWGAWQVRIDVETGAVLSPERHLWSGTGGVWPEGPHIFRRGEYYYLMLAEGGTEYGHGVVVARGPSASGPFEEFCPHNPVLTQVGRLSEPVQATGHADFVEDAEGRWWAVFLGIRPIGRRLFFHTLGRETFLAPVEWVGGWPVVNGGAPVRLPYGQAGVFAVTPGPVKTWRDEFEGGEVRLEWNWRRNPVAGHYDRQARPSWWGLRGAEAPLTATRAYTWVGRRQQHFGCRVETLMEFQPGCDGEEAGLCVLMNDGHHYEVGVVREGGERVAFVRRVIDGLGGVVARKALPEPSGRVRLEIVGEPQRYTLMLRDETGAVVVTAEGSSKYLAKEVAGGFTGTYFGLYATGNGRESDAWAWFDYLEYTVVPSV